MLNRHENEHTYFTQPDRKYKLRWNVQTLITLITCLISSLQEDRCCLSLDVRCQNQETNNEAEREANSQWLKTVYIKCQKKHRTNSSLKARAGIKTGGARVNQASPEEGFTYQSICFVQWGRMRRKTGECNANQH